MKNWISIAGLVATISLIGNWIGYGVPISDSLVGMLIILIVASIGTFISKWNSKLSATVCISLLGLLVTTPIFPFHNFIFAHTKQVNFLALATPALAYVGLSLGKDMDSLKSLSWRIVVVSLMVFTGTFVISGLLAQLTIHLT